MARFNGSSSGVVGALFLALAVGPVACGGGDGQPDDRQAALDREMDVALEDLATEPELLDQLRDQLREELREELRQELRDAPPPARRATPPPPPPPPAPAPSAEPAPAPAPPPPATVTLMAPAGTTFRAELAQELSTRTNRVGDSFTVRLVEPIVAGRSVLAPAQTVVRGTVTGIRRGDEGTVIELDFREIFVGGQYHPIRASVVSADIEKRSRQGTGERAAKVGGGAVAGAILGRVIGGDAKGTVIGAVVGAAAGTGIMLATDGKDAVMPAGSEITIRLDAPLEVEVDG